MLGSIRKSLILIFIPLLAGFVTQGGWTQFSILIYKMGTLFVP